MFAIYKLILYLIAILFIPIRVPSIADSCRIDGIVRVKQLTSYCGPAVMSSVMTFYGVPLTQLEIGRNVFNKLFGATLGSELLYFAHEHGFSAYSFTGSRSTLKDILTDNHPVIVLQQNSQSDKSGHFRIVTGFNDNDGVFYITDPYYDEITELTYTLFDTLSNRMNYWALLVIPTDEDTYTGTFIAANAVFYLDLAEAMTAHGNPLDAIVYAKLALEKEPNNAYAKSLITRARRAIP